MENSTEKRKLKNNEIALALGAIYLVFILLMLLDVKSSYSFNDVNNPSALLVPDYVDSFLSCGFVLSLSAFAYLLLRDFTLGKNGGGFLFFANLLWLPVYPIFLMVMDASPINFKSEQLIIESRQGYKEKYEFDVGLVKDCFAAEGPTRKECFMAQFGNIQTLRMATILINKLALNASDFRCEDINPQALTNHINAYKQLEAKENEYRDVPFLATANKNPQLFQSYRLNLTEIELAYYKAGCGQLYKELSEADR